MKTEKTITCKATKYDLERIEAIKRMYANAWNCDPKEISTSDVIRWSIGHVFYQTEEGEAEMEHNRKMREDRRI